MNPSGLEVSYSLDVMDGNGTPALGYAQIRCSDGELFSMTREVVKGLDAPVEDKQPVSSRPLHRKSTKCQRISNLPPKWLMSM